MTTPQIIGEAGRGLNVGGLIAYLNTITLDLMSDKEQFNNLN